MPGEGVDGYSEPHLTPQSASIDDMYPNTGMPRAGAGGPMPAQQQQPIGGGGGVGAIDQQYYRPPPTF